MYVYHDRITDKYETFATLSKLCKAKGFNYYTVYGKMRRNKTDIWKSEDGEIVAKVKK